MIVFFSQFPLNSNTLKTPDPLKMFGLPTLTPGPPFSTRVKPISAEMIVWVLVVVGHPVFICIEEEEIENFRFCDNCSHPLTGQAR